MFISTRDKNNRKAFSQAIFEGLAGDGGLFVPEEWKDLSTLYQSLTGASFNEMASAVTAEILSDELSREDAESIVNRAFSFEPHFNRLDNNISVMELFHGPSCAFKDFGASFLASSMEFFLQDRSKPAVILTATSGDTGSAVAQAFHQKENIHVVILYPSGRVSPLQEKQLTTLGDNITALEVKGNFDDCQRMVKDAFMEASLKKTLGLTSANSINLGRLIPQSFYYIYGFLKEKRASDTPFSFCVPSGNFGNLTAGIYAWKWGLPVGPFIASTNQNDVVPQYLFTGEYQPRPSVATYSNAMDVGDPSNFERLLHTFHHDWKEMKYHISGYSVTDSETLRLMNEFYQRHNHFIDPHTAVGIQGAKRFLHDNSTTSKGDVMVLSTASPAKFTEVVEKATGKQPPLPQQLEKCLHRKKESIVIDNTLKSLKSFLSDSFDS